MKKFFEFFGILCLIWFSFFYTEKTINVVSELDDVMIKIKEYAENYEVKAIDAEVTNETIIPGQVGKTIDINKSYKRMKRINSFDEKLLVYKESQPKVSIDNIYNKYVISGYKNKKMMSLIFLINEHDDVSTILNILDKHGLKGNFFVDGNWFELNNEMVEYLIKNDHVLGNLSYNMDYSNSSFVWMDTIIEKAFKQSNGYCLKNGTNDLKYCTLQKNHTIEPKIIVEKNPANLICDNLDNGAIIGVEVNNQLYKELDLIINCIKNRDLKFTTISDLLKE